MVKSQQTRWTPRGARFLLEIRSNARGDPFVVSIAHGRVGDLVGAEAFGVFPRASGDETYEHDGEAVPVGCAWPVTTERMIMNAHGHERSDCRPDRTYHFGVERALSVQCYAPCQWCDWRRRAASWLSEI